MESALAEQTRLGAHPIGDGQVRFRVWAPNCQQVEVCIANQAGDYQCSHLIRDDHGYFEGEVSAEAGNDYHYRLDGTVVRPDPASNFQPHGVHGDSQIIDRDGFDWSDDDWQGRPKRELVIYELHVGCFTNDGTYEAAIEKLPYLKSLGVTAVELMPVAQAPGRWNWGYDGVSIFAPNHNYGGVDDLKAFVNACHEQGFAVLLDVVYNHLGPEGNYLRDFGPYFSQKYHTPWGEAVNFDGDDAGPVRSFIIENALYWLDEFHFDGLRLDAAHFLFDNSDEPILSTIRNAVTEFSQSSGREIHLIAEANIFDRSLLQASPRNRQSASYDAIWCDCLMHSIYHQSAADVRLTRREYRGGSEIAEALRHGYLYRSQPQLYQAPDKRPVRAVDSERIAKSTSADEYESLIFALQTHDSVGNHPHGQRIHQLASVDFQKAAAALILLSPAIPLIFMGEEQAIDAPFPFFVDFEDPHLRRVVDEGRANEYPQHAWEGAISPSDERAFSTAKLTSDVKTNAGVEQWYRTILRIRSDGIRNGWLSKANLKVDHRIGSSVFVLRYSTDEGPALTVASHLGPASPSEPTQLSGIVAADSQSRHPAEVSVVSPQLQSCQCLILEHGADPSEEQN